MYLLLEEARQLELHTKDFVAERVHTNFFRDGKGLLVVFECIFGLNVVVGVVEGATELLGNWFGEGGELADDVRLVEIVGVYETKAGADDAGDMSVSIAGFVSMCI